MRKTTIVILLLGVIILSACDLDEKLVRGSGDIVSLDQDLSDFNKIDASHSFDISVSQGDGYAVVVRVDDNLEDELDVKVQGGTLHLDLARDIIVNNATLEADITMPSLDGLDLSGASSADITGFDSSDPFSARLSGSSSLSGDLVTGDLNLDLSGSSEVALDGAGGDLEIDASGASDVKLPNYPVEDADLNLSGSSDVLINLSGTLDVDASGSSNVTYLGSPTLGDIRTSGSSSISRE